MESKNNSLFKATFAFTMSLATCLALTAQVGINTTNPQTQLHLAGTGASNTIRIESLNSTNNVINNGIDNAVVAVNSNGDLILQDSVHNFSVDANESNTFFASPVALSSPSGAFGFSLVHSETFTLTRETLIEVVFWTGCEILNADGVSFVDDGQPRIYGGIAFLDNGAGGILQDIVYSANTYTNADTTPFSFITTAHFSVGGNGYIFLPAGTHTISLGVFASGGANTALPSDGYQITFGSNFANRFQIIQHN